VIRRARIAALSRLTGHHDGMLARTTVVALLIVAATGQGAAIAASFDTATSRALDCRDPIDALNTPASFVEPIAGAVALQTRSSSRTALQTGTTSRPGGPSTRLFAKTPLFVRTGRKAQLIVPQKWVGRLSVTWGNTGQGITTRALTVGPCPGRARWLVFPGGYFLAQPACVELIVRVAGKDRHIQIGVGAPCPGQLRPPQPSAS
jgi:hypothetical protein